MPTTSPIPWRLTLSLSVVAMSAIAAPILTPHDPSRQFDTTVARHLPPGSQRWELTSPTGRSVLTERVDRPDGAIAFERRGRCLLASAAAEADSIDFPRRRLFPLGTDRLGRDCLSRILYGGRISLLVGLLATAMSTFLGITVGAVAGFSPGIADTLSMRALDALMAFPQLFVVLVLASFFNGGIAFLVLFLGVTGWMPIARIVRAEIRSLAASDFITAARSLGLSPRRVLWRHAVPNIVAPLGVAVTLRFADVIVVESSLSFLGLGVRPPTPSWGGMIASGAAEMDTFWWVATFPGIALVATVVAVNSLADHLRRRVAGGHGWRLLD